jgi:predicted secreted protein
VQSARFLGLTEGVWFAILAGVGVESVDGSGSMVSGDSGGIGGL